MTKWLTLLVVGLLLGLPTTALALNSEWHSHCPLSTTTGAPTMTGATDSGHSISARGQVGCWIFNSSATGNSPAISITTESGLVWFDPDTTGTAITTATVKVHWCIGNSKPDDAQSPQNVCPELGGAQAGTTTVTGAEGDPSVQNAGLRVAPGVYYIEIISAADCAAGNGKCAVWVRGEGVNP